MFRSIPLIFVLLLAPPTASAQTSKRLGLGGKTLGLGRSKGRTAADPKTVRFELELLGAINGLRKKKNLPALVMNDELRSFARQQSEWGATDNPQAKTSDRRIKAQGLAPYGYRMQYAFGTKAKRVLRDLKKEKEATESLFEEFARIGVGAFWVPEEKPYFQVTVLVARDPDPMAGRTGLTRAQTDPVMARGSVQIKKYCYDPALVKNPNLTGNLIFQIVVGAGGSVTNAKLLSKTSSASFNACALSQVRVLQFPAPYKDKPVTLNHPMRFTPPQGSVRIGKLTASQITHSFSAAKADFRACYDKRVKSKPKLHGTILLAVTVAPDGSIAQLGVETDEPNDAQLRKCVLERARRVRFPKPEFGGVASVKFPLRFDPPQEN